MTPSLSTSPTPSSRILGLVGIVGGLGLLSAFAIGIVQDLNVLRLAVFNLGAIAIVAGVHRRQALAAPRTALLGALPALIANTWFLVMVLLAIGRERPFSGDFGFVAFLAGVAMWLADAWFGALTLRLAVVTRWGALALAIGSVLAVLGIDRLELVSGSLGGLVGPLALAGIALNGIGWVLLGLDLAVARGWPATKLRDSLP